MIARIGKTAGRVVNRIDDAKYAVQRRVDRARIELHIALRTVRNAKAELREAYLQQRGLRASGVEIIEGSDVVLEGEVMKHCYQCDAPVKYLFSDSRCSQCTRTTPHDLTDGYAV